MIKIVMVEYLNTIPFRYGFEHLDEEIDLQLKIPSECGKSFYEGDADIALIPVGSWLKNGTQFPPITQYCIGAEGKVATVMLYANKPIDELTKIYLDSHSNTSNLLIKTLCEHYYQRDITFSLDQVEELSIAPDEGKIMIGDKVFHNKTPFAYAYDLAEEWGKFQNLPFVFAIWVAKPHVPQAFIHKINKAFDHAFNKLQEIIKIEDPIYPSINLDEYFSKHISYVFNDSKKQALDEFKKLSSLKKEIV